jgi:uncharacterized protein YjbI with pentapeptide repeats
MDPTSQPPAPQPPAQGDLTRQKTEAEIKKLQREAEKLEKETAAIPRADLVRRKAELERDKVALELTKLASDRRRDRWVEPLKAIAGLSSILLALVAVGSLWVSLETARQAAAKAEAEAQRAERELVSSLIRDLGAEQRSVRATSAWRLGAYMNHPKFESIVIGSLSATVALEEQGEVQDAMLLALQPLRPLAQLQLLGTRSQLEGEIVRLLSNLDAKTRVLTDADEARVQNKQQALIKITLTLAGSSSCAAAPCVPNFDSITALRRARFFNFRGRLKGATFQRAAVTEADFFGLDLTGARFDGALVEAASFIKAELVDARFDGANMRLIDHVARPIPRTEFRNANLKGATFVDACLAGADFTGSNVDPAALAKGYTEGIMIEADKLAKLGTPRSHTSCQTVHEK